jgi:hypothetical protein
MLDRASLKKSSCVVANRSEGQLLQSVYTNPQPAGRGYLVRRSQPPELVQLARFATAAEPDGEPRG